MVDSMKQIFLLKPEVLTPNRNGFMAKKRKWHLKAGSTVCILDLYPRCLQVLFDVAGVEAQPLVGMMPS